MKPITLYEIKDEDQLLEDDALAAQKQIDKSIDLIAEIYNMLIGCGIEDIDGVTYSFWINPDTSCFLISNSYADVIFHGYFNDGGIVEVHDHNVDQDRINILNQEKQLLIDHINGKISKKNEAKHKIFLDRFGV